MSDDITDVKDIWQTLISPFARTIAQLLKEPSFRSKIAELFIERPNQYVLVLGTSGVGKTALVRSLVGGSPYVRGQERTLQPEEFVLISDGLTFNIIDTPGHSGLKDDARALVDKIAKERQEDTCIGVINVVSYGYHEASPGTEQNAIDKKENKVKDSYLKECRKKEFELLRDWMKYFRDKAYRVDWLLTLVSKADLWWTPDTQDTVMGYYTNHRGEYVSNGIGEREDSERLSHHVCVHSSIQRLFYDRIAMSGYYSSLQQAVDCQNTVRSMIRLTDEACKRRKR